MDKFNYARTASRVDSLLKRFGRTMTIKTPSVGEYNPATGTVEAISEPFTGTGVVFDYGHKDIDGTLIQVNDKRVYLSVNGLPETITTADILTIGDVDYKIINSKPLAPSGINVLFELQVRA